MLSFQTLDNIKYIFFVTAIHEGIIRIVKNSYILLLEVPNNLIPIVIGIVGGTGIVIIGVGMYFALSRIRKGKNKYQRRFSNKI